MKLLDDDTAAWIRDHAWTPAMRNPFLLAVGVYSTCLCQNGRSHACGRGQHKQCPDPLRSWHTIIRRPDNTVAQFPKPYQHRTESDLGADYERSAFVWLADRVCRWQCPCNCHTAPALSTPVQLDLFAAAS